MNNSSFTELKICITADRTFLKQTRWLVLARYATVRLLLSADADEKKRSIEILRTLSFAMSKQKFCA